MNDSATSRVGRPRNCRRICSAGVSGVNSTPVISRCNARQSCSESTVRRGSGRFFRVADFAEVLVCLERFVMDFMERGYARVPLEQRGGVTAQPHGVIVQL